MLDAVAYFVPVMVLESAIKSSVFLTSATVHARPLPPIHSLAVVANHGDPVTCIGLQYLRALPSNSA